jgi:hypothetical protein
MDIIDDWTLPWPAIKVPTYQTRRVGAWELRRQNQPVLRGYFRGLQACTENYLLMRDNRVWISLSPVEIESLAPRVAHMRGHVVIAGLGMGLALYNALLRPAVRQITVLELDSEGYRPVRVCPRNGSFLTRRWRRESRANPSLNGVLRRPRIRTRFQGDYG